MWSNSSPPANAARSRASCDPCGVSAPPDDVDARIDQLYCAPLDRFVPERSALTKALRAEGRREEATKVSRLQKPALAAWAVNQVVRSQAKAARALWDAGDAVLDVQARAVTGEAGGDDLRAAIAAQRAALAPLADAARGLLTGRGAFLNEQAVQAVIETLHAAAVDREAREDVEAGRLARPLRLAGLGALAGGGAARAAPSPADEPDEPDEPADEEAARSGAKRSPGEQQRRADEERRAEEQRRNDEERLREREREKSLAAARRTLDRARAARNAAAQRVERRRSELEAAQDELERLEAEVRAAEEAVGE